MASFFFLKKKAARRVGIDKNIHGRHPRRFKADDATPIGKPLFISNIEMLAGKTIDRLHFPGVIIMIHTDSGLPA